MIARKVLLLEPPYHNKYPPMGLMKLATYFRERGDDVRFFKGNLKKFAANLLCDDYINKVNDVELLKHRLKIFGYIRTGRYAYIDAIPNFRESENEVEIIHYRRNFVDENYPKFDIIAVTTLFTFYWKDTINTINGAKKFLSDNGRIIVGGIASTILPEQIYKDTGVKPIVGLLNKSGIIDKGDKTIIDKLPLDYSILEEIDYKYPTGDAYFAYTTRGCPNRCAFCVVPRLEPKYCNYISIKKQFITASEKYGKRKNLLLMDNNIFASKSFNKVIDEIKECGFGKNATYIPLDEYKIALANIKAPKKAKNNIRAYIIKMLNIYDSIMERLPEDEQGEFYLKRQESCLLYPVLAKKEKIIEFDKIVRPLYERFFKRSTNVRYVDFNQGVDARLVTDENMAKLSEINIKPLRIAFDHYKMKKIYIDAVRSAAKHGIHDLSNYLLYNYKDKPEELYERMKINIDLCDQLGVNIYSFPMKYHPIDDPNYFNNRDYIGIHWSRKFIRAIQAVLNSTKGKIGRGKSFFEEAFGCDVDEFKKILWMPETFIIYRRKHDAILRKRLSDKYGKYIEGESDLTNEWWNKFCALSDKRREILEKLIEPNQFKNINSLTNDSKILEVLKYYTIFRKEAK
jgi:hypothetical protein